MIGLRSLYHRLAPIAALGAALATNASAAPPLSEALAGLPLSDAQKASLAPRGGEIVTAEPKATNERELSFAVGFVVVKTTREDRGDEVMHGAVLAKNPDVVAHGDLTSGTPGEFSGCTSRVPTRRRNGWRRSRAGSSTFRARRSRASPRYPGRGGAALQGAVESQLYQALSARVKAYRGAGTRGDRTLRARKSRREAGRGPARREPRVGTDPHARPGFQKLLEGYPSGKGTGFVERYRWIVSKAGDEPTVLLDHLFAQPDGDSWGLAHRQYFVSTQYNAEQDAVLLQPVAEGTLVLLMSRTSTDQVAGFGGGAKRAIGSKMMGKALVEMAERSRSVLQP